MAGLLLHSPADVMSRLLVLLGVGTDPDAEPLGAWPVYCDTEPALPDNLLRVRDTSAQDDGRTQTDGERQEHPGFQVTVRSQTFPAGAAKANAVAIALDGQYQDVVTVGASSYEVHSVSRRGGVLYLGQEKTASRRYLFTINGVFVVRMSG